MSNQDVNALGFFFAGSPNLPLRQKLALAMLARNKKFPTNLGEGIASIGQEIGDTLAHRSILEEDRAAMQAAATATVPPIADSAVPPTTPPQAPAVGDVAPDIVPAQPRPSRTVTPAPIPPQDGTLGNRGDTLFPTHANGLTAPTTQPPVTRSALPPSAPPPAVAPPMTPPVMAQGGAPANVPPDEESRRAIAHAMLRQQTGGAPPPAAAEQQPPVPPRPSVADFGQPSALAATPPQAIPAAPPAAPIRAIPPQGPPQPEAVPGYVPPMPGTPQGAPTIQPGPREQQLQAFMAANSGNIHMAQSKPARELQALVTERERKQKEADKLFEAEVARGNKQIELRTTGQMDQAKRIEDVRTAQQEQEKRVEEITKLRDENKLRAQFANLPPDVVFKKVTESQAVASSAAKSLAASQAAMEAFKGGAITGSGANLKLDVAKLFTGMGLVDKGDLIANTETFRGAMQPVVASLLKQTSGTSQLSEGELRFAERAAAGDIRLDPKSITMLMGIIDKASTGVVLDHQKLTKAMFGDDPKAHAAFGVELPKVRVQTSAGGETAAARKWLEDNPNDPRAPAVRQRLGM